MLYLCHQRRAGHTVSAEPDDHAQSSYYTLFPSTHDYLRLLSYTTSVLVHKSLQNYCLHRFKSQSRAYVL